MNGDRVSDIKTACAADWRVRVEMLDGKSRLRPFVRARQVAMYLTRDLTMMSLPQIGRAFGGRDHTTVLHAVRFVQAQIDREPRWEEDVARIRAALVAGWSSS